MVEIDLTLPQESIDALKIDPAEYQDGTFSLTTPGEKWALRRRYKPKGPRLVSAAEPQGGVQGQDDHSVPGQRFLGLKMLTLNNMIQDPSMIHEVLAYEVFRAAGVAASRTGYAYVRVNEQDTAWT